MLICERMIHISYEYAVQIFFYIFASAKLYLRISII
jgi:hypothetical protein